MNVQPPTAFVEGKVGLKRILPTRAEGDADYEPTVSNWLYFNLYFWTNMTLSALKFKLAFSLITNPELACAVHNTWHHENNR